jgi:uncharacterized protein YndB with AHSA1/START domain
MSVIHVSKDLDNCTLTVTAEFSASVDQVWSVWSDPRRLERWWGPPGYPATFVAHDLVAGGRMRYFMTGPGGEKYHGGWDVVSVDPPRSIEFEDWFADGDGAKDPNLPVARTLVTLTAIGDRIRMEIVSTYSSRAEIDRVIEMGVEEGIVEAIGQIDGILAAA